jgi:hypothetical protein
MDALTPGYPGALSGPFLDAIGAKTYKIPGRDLDINSAAQFPQNNIYMKAEEYNEFIQDPFNFFLEKSIPRKHYHLREMPRKEISIIKGALEYARYGEILMPLILKIGQKYGMPPLYQSAIPTGPLDFIGDFLRTLPELFLDMKRRPEELKAAAEAMVPLLVKYGEFAFDSPTNFPWIMIPLHVGMFLRPKDFEEFYWPSFKKMTDILIQDGFTPCYIGESNWTPYLDFLAELPKGTVWLFEEMDWDKANDELSNLAFGGTLSLDLLRFGTKEQVISEVKDQIEKYGSRGGFLILPPAPLMNINDAKPQNAIALANYFLEKRLN